MEEISIGFVTRGRQLVPAVKIPCSNGALLLRPVQSSECEVAKELLSREFDRAVQIFQGGMIAPAVQKPLKKKSPAKSVQATKPQARVVPNPSPEVVSPQGSHRMSSMGKGVDIQYSKYSRRDMFRLVGCESWKRSRNTQYK